MATGRQRNDFLWYPLDMDDPPDYTATVTAAMLWDMLEPEFVPFFCEDAGVTIPDADVAAKESAASIARRRNVMVLYPMIEVFSVIAAEIDALVNIRPGILGETPEELAELRDQWEMQAHGTILPASLSIIAQLTERGYLEVTDKARTGKLRWAVPVR